MTVLLLPGCAVDMCSIVCLGVCVGMCRLARPLSPSGVRFLLGYSGLPPPNVKKDKMADKFEFPGFVGLSAMQSLVFSFVLWTLGQVLGIFCLFLLVFWCNLFGLFLGVGSLALVFRFSLPCLRKLTLCLLKKKPPFVSITQYSRKITLILFDRTAGTTLWGVSYLAALGKSFFPFSVPLPGWLQNSKFHGRLAMQCLILHFTTWTLFTMFGAFIIICSIFSFGFPACIGWIICLLFLLRRFADPFYLRLHVWKRISDSLFSAFVPNQLSTALFYAGLFALAFMLKDTVGFDGGEAQISLNVGKGWWKPAHLSVALPPATFAIQAKDLFGNANTNEANVVNFVVKLKTGDGSVVAKPTPVFLNTGQYSVSYNLSSSGLYDLSVTLNNTQIEGNPFTVNVGKTAVDASKTSVSGTLSGVAGVQQLGDTILSTASSVTSPLIGKSGVRVVCDSHTGLHNVTYKAEKSGQYMFSIRLFGSEIENSPFQTSVSPNNAVVDVSQSDFPGAGLLGASAGVSTSFTVQSKDTWGNTRIADAGVAVQVEPSVSTQRVSFSCNSTGQGAVVGTYTCTRAGNFTSSVNVRHNPTSTSFTKHFNNFIVAVGTTRETSFVSRGLKSNGKWLTGVFVGQVGSFTTQAKDAAVDLSPATYTIQAKDSIGNARTNEASKVDNSVVKLEAGDGTVVAEPTPVFLNSGQYSVSYNLSSSGLHDLSVTLNNTQIGGSPLSVNIGKTAVDASKASVSGTLSGVAGGRTSFCITPRDFTSSVYTDCRQRFLIFAKTGSMAPLQQLGVRVVCDSHTGLYNVTYKAEKSGQHMFSIRLFGSEIENSSFQTFVSPNNAVVDVSQSDFLGAGLLGASAGVSTSFTVQSKDTWGNTRTADSGVAVMVEPSVSTQSVSLSCNSTGQGAVVCTYTCARAGNFTKQFANFIVTVGFTRETSFVSRGLKSNGKWLTDVFAGQVGSFTISGTYPPAKSQSSASSCQACPVGSVSSASSTPSVDCVANRVKAEGVGFKTPVSSTVEQAMGSLAPSLDVTQALPYSSTVKKTQLYSSTVEKHYSYTVNNTLFLVVPRKGGSRPPSPTPSPHQGKARHVPPIPVGPYSAGTLPLRGSSSAAPTPLLLQEGGKASRTGAVAGASPSGAAPATLPLSGVDARSCHYFCGEDEHRTLSLPHGRGVRSAVPHCLVLPSGEEKRQPFAALVSKGAKVVSSPPGRVSPALYAAFRALGQQASLEDPGGEAVSDVGSPTRTTSPPRRSQFSPGPLSSQTGSVVVGCGVLSPLSGGAVARVCVNMGGNSHCLRRAAGPLCGAASVRTVEYVCVMGGCLQRRSTPPYRWCAVGAVRLVDRPCQRFVLPEVVVRGGSSAPTNRTAAFTTVASSLVFTDATVSPSQVNSTDTDATAYSKTTASPSSTTTLTSPPAAQDNPSLPLPLVGRGGGELLRKTMAV